jgi:hypothetical protein
MTNQSPAKQKLYCYVDESGQDTKGDLFLVVVVVADTDPAPLRALAERIEQTSRKGMRKWFHTNRERRREYIKQLVDTPAFRNHIYFARYEHSKEYADLTVLTTAKAILAVATPPYEATISIDGLAKAQRHAVARGLRTLHIQVHKVRGLSDEADALIRLADAVAGCIRDCLEGNQELTPLYEQALRTKIIQDLK